MNDGIIHGPPSSIPRVTVSDVATPVKILSLPPNMPSRTMVEGEVLANEKGVLTLKTEQGMVMLDARAMPLSQMKQGQVLQFRLDLAGTKAEMAMMAELVSIMDTGSKPREAVTTPPPVSIPDQINLAQQNSIDPLTALEAKLIALPQRVDAESLAMIIKTLLRLPLQDPLPPSLQEGMEKFQLLTRLLTQANFVSENALQAGDNGPDMPNGLLTALQQLVRTPEGKSNPLLAQLPQQFIQLQTVLPGQTLSPNILVEMREQLQALMQSATAKTSATGTDVPRYTMPAIGMVMGMPQGFNSGSSLGASLELKGANLVVLLTPQNQPLIGLLGTDGKLDSKPLLPGTVFVVAFKPQVDQVLNLPLVPMAMMLDEAGGLVPLGLSLGNTWPALDDLWKTALAQQGIQPDLMAMLQRVVPSPQPHQLPPALLFFMAVIKNGMMSDWIPEKLLDGLNKTEAVRQLLSDMRAMQTRMNEDGPADAWKPLPVPLQVGDNLVRLQFFYRNSPDQESDQAQGLEKHNKTRFVLNIPQTGFGDIQIDGLVRAKDLEMILRTERTLSSKIESDIRDRYQKAMDMTGMNGNIMFQQGREHYVRV